MTAVGSRNALDNDELAYTKLIRGYLMRGDGLYLTIHF